ncbi:MAG: methyltransferase [Deltaproteobacteria bacterium]|nr:methyltransferase [Deltaproteobacteria bacterium]
MNEDRILEIEKEAEARYERLISSVTQIPGITLDILPPESADDFIDRGLYEFTEYRKVFGGRLIFICLKTADGQAFFLERFRIYGRESPQGIERADDPSYINGVGESLYLRIPQGSTILDIGCGTGKYLKLLKGRGVAAMAMDMSRELIVEDRKSLELREVHFFPGDCADLRFLNDREIEFLTGVNILNVLFPDMVESLLAQAARVARSGALFAFTLPARADLWGDMAEPPKEGPYRASAEYIEMASNQTFLGQMKLFTFVRKLSKEKGWRCRIFKFLDRSIFDIATLNKTLDAGYLKPGEDSLLKLLEFPVRFSRSTGVQPEGSRLVCAVGYGLEISFGGEVLPSAEEVFYFDDRTEFEKLDIRSELRDSIKCWNLPFES